MYNSQPTISTNNTRESHPAKPPKGKKNRRKKRMLGAKITAIALSSVLFGGTAGVTFYGVNHLLPDSQETYGQSASQSSSASLSNVSYNSDTASQSMDVSAIAAQGLTSVVSVTNISVQEVQNYFGQFGGSGRGKMQLQETTSCGSGVITYSDDSYLYMVTNYHVVEGAATLSVTFVDDQTYEAQLCGYDESMDIALLKVSVDTLSSDTLSQISVVTIGDSDELTVGEQVVAIGNALGYGQSVTTGTGSDRIFDGLKGV